MRCWQLGAICIINAPRPWLEQSARQIHPTFSNSNQPKRKPYDYPDRLDGPGACCNTRNNLKLRKTTTLQRFASNGFFRRKISLKSFATTATENLDRFRSFKARTKTPGILNLGRTAEPIRAKGRRRNSMPADQLCKGMAEIEGAQHETTAELEQAEDQGCPARFRRGNDRGKVMPDGNPDLFLAKRQQRGSTRTRPRSRASVPIRNS